MTRLWREESSGGVAHGPRIRPRVKEPFSHIARSVAPMSITHLTKLEPIDSQNQDKRFASPWGLSIDDTRLKDGSRVTRSRLKHIRLDKLEPRLTSSINAPSPRTTAVHRRVPRLHPTPHIPDRVDPGRVPVPQLSDLGFNDTVQDLFARIDSLSKFPLFKQLNTPGLDTEKEVNKSSRSKAMEETDSKSDETGKQMLHYVREREAALDEVKKIKMELTETQSKLYDATKLIEELEKKVPKSKNTVKKAAPPKKKPPNSPTPSKKQAKTTSNGSGGGTAAMGSDGLYHPPTDMIDPSADSRDYYWKLAEAFPTLPMMQVLDAEKKFMDADTDNSGYIDKDELDKVMCDTVGLFTPKQVEEIFNEVDTNNSEGVDFYEVLVILNKLHNRRRTNLPQSVQQNYSKTCNVQ